MRVRVIPYFSPYLASERWAVEKKIWLLPWWQVTSCDSEMHAKAIARQVKAGTWRPPAEERHWEAK